MEVIFNITNLKSLITFVHLVGLAIGVGGAWMLDAFIIKHMNSVISKDKYYTIEFVSKFVIIGLAMLWFSGFLFIGYYYLYTPEYLENQKVWGKLFIVVILTLNGYFVHKKIMPTLKNTIGSTLTRSLKSREITTMTVIGTISFISWLFPVVLGVTKTLNFTVPAVNIIIFYIGILAITLIFTRFIAKAIFQSEKTI